MIKTFLLSSVILLSALASLAQSINYKEVASAKSRPKGPFKEYVSRLGHIYKVGDSIAITTPSSGIAFAFIEVVPHGDGMIRRLRQDQKNKNVQITNLRVDKSASRGFSLIAHTSGTTEKDHYIIYLESALDAGEVDSSSHNALDKLKKAKEKFDLELISREDYEAIKKQLAPYIK